MADTPTVHIVETMTTAPLTMGARHRLDRQVRDLMTPGVITIPEDSSLRQKAVTEQPIAVHPTATVAKPLPHTRARGSRS